ncbi:hypothetical protein, partial [Novosphingobium naphthalenivorans]|uniref:hypothetical protein n=1 Tax=Novosphingobium naphthalenivorans TaxID=273168 RepID=UPI000A7E9DB0
SKISSLLNIGAPKSQKAPVVVIEQSETDAATREIQVRASLDFSGSGKPTPESNIVDFSPMKPADQDLSPSEAERGPRDSAANAPEQTPDGAPARHAPILPEATFGMVEADAPMDGGDPAQVSDANRDTGKAADTAVHGPADEDSGVDEYHRYALDPDLEAAMDASPLHVAEPSAHRHRLRAQIGASLQPEDAPESPVMTLLRRVFGWIWR